MARREVRRARRRVRVRSRRPRHRGVGAAVLRVPHGPERDRVRRPQGCQEKSISNIG